jgi:hypothetical protein
MEMDMIGFGLSGILFLLWIGVGITALFALRQRLMGEVTCVLWAARIVAVPVLGAIAFWIVDPQSGEKGGAG